MDYNIELSLPFTAEWIEITDDWHLILPFIRYFTKAVNINNRENLIEFEFMPNITAQMLKSHCSSSLTKCYEFLQSDKIKKKDLGIPIQSGNVNVPVRVIDKILSYSDKLTPTARPLFVKCILFLLVKCLQYKTFKENFGLTTTKKYGVGNDELAVILKCQRTTVSAILKKIEDTKIVVKASRGCTSAGVAITNKFELGEGYEDN